MARARKSSDDENAVTAAPVRAVPSEPLPWHGAALAQLSTAWAQDRLPHALLIHGPAGVGKLHLAHWLARALLCERRGPAPRICGECAGCRLTAAGSHPDLRFVEPEEGKQQISIDHVRAAATGLTMTSHQQGWKVCIVDPAHLMTASAANGLLKTLEEPTPRSLLILVGVGLQDLPATIRSRCQRLAVRPPPAGQALAWVRAQSGQDISPQALRFSGGAPLRALAQANGQYDALETDMQEALTVFLAGRTDVTRVAKAWGDDALPQRLAWLDLWLAGLARRQLDETDDLVTFPGAAVPLPRPLNALNISRVFQLSDRVRELKAQLARTALNRELAAATLLVDLQQTFAP